MDSEFEFTDRYDALGISPPDLAAMCQGDCEGVGWYPVLWDTDDPIDRALWDEAHRTGHTISARVRSAWECRDISVRAVLDCLFEPCDGWHFVQCPECGGTGKRRGDE